MPQKPYPKWPVFRRSIVAAFQRSLTPLQRGRRINRRNDFVHPQHIGPQLLVAEGVVAEDGLLQFVLGRPETDLPAVVQSPRDRTRT